MNFHRHQRGHAMCKADSARITPPNLQKLPGLRAKHCKTQIGWSAHKHLQRKATCRFNPGIFSSTNILQAPSSSQKLSVHTQQIQLKPVALVSSGCLFRLFWHHHSLLVGKVVQHRQETDEIPGACNTSVSGTDGLMEQDASPMIHRIPLWVSTIGRMLHDASRSSHTLFNFIHMCLITRTEFLSQIISKQCVFPKILSPLNPVGFSPVAGESISNSSLPTGLHPMQSALGNTNAVGARLPGAPQHSARLDLDDRGCSFAKTRQVKASKNVEM